LIDILNDVTCHRKSFLLEIPWPDRRLSPNAREHWAVTSKHKKLFRARCRAIGMASGVGVLSAAENAVSVHLTFFPPDKRARDWDNMLAAMKAGLDGLADAMGVDDSKWKLGFDVSDPVKGGIVLVQVTGEAR
jgi:crossover junction endodeoxyribonuclease RusA